MSLMRLRAIPWLLLFETVMLARERWTRLTPEERAELAAIARRSAGHPHRVPASDRETVRRLAAKLDLVGAVRDAAPIVRRRLRRR